MFSIAIQAGGGSTRMGKNKALLNFLGEPLISRVISRVSTQNSNVFVTTNYPEDYRFLKLPLVEDVIRDRGALGGLFTALHYARDPIAAVVACDMPFVNSDIIQMGVEIIQQTNVDVVIPSSEKGLEPFHAVYRRSTCLKAVEQAIKMNQYRTISWHPNVQVHTLEPESYSHLDKDNLSFLNLNTPQEFKMAERIARQKDHTSL